MAVTVGPEQLDQAFLSRQREVLGELRKTRAHAVGRLAAEVSDLISRQETGAAASEGFGTGETASAQVEQAREHLSQAQARLDEVDNAILRLDTDRYGLCDMCGTSIGRDRLEAIPTAARCIQCQSRPKGGGGGVGLASRYGDPVLGHSLTRRRLEGMDVMSAIYGRRAVRAYTSDPVSREEVRTLLHAAIQAPSAVNSQPWAFVVIQQPEVLDDYERQAVDLLVAEPLAPEVAMSGLPDLEQLRRRVAAPGYRLFHGARTLVVVYATAANGVPDCFLAAQNLMLAACAMGLGTCPIGLASPLFNRPEVKQALGIRPEWSAALPIVIGHPSGGAPLTARRPPDILAWR
jgi:nitroreductase/RNA polymerase-binding transcription factor DksA